MRKDVNPID